MLANVFEKIINSSFKTYGLYFSHYLSAQFLSEDALLNMTNVRLGFISDAHMILFFYSLGDVVFYNSERYSKSNNKYIISYDLRQESEQIIYLHTNNIYIYIYIYICDL